MKNNKIEWRLIFGIIGWALVVLIWIWMSVRYFRKDDWVGGVLNMIVAVCWAIFGKITIKKYLSKK